MAENDQNTEAQPAAAADENRQLFQQQRFYLKDVSFEAPNTPAVFKEPYNPNINFNLNNRINRIDDGIFESVLRLTADVKQNDKSVFLAEVQYAGIFEIRNYDNNQMEQLLNIACPNLIFPYAKEALESLVVKASFPPLMLSPVNFEMVYLQAKARREQQAAAEQTAQAEENPQ